MSFEKFIPPRKSKTPQVSIKRTGTISFDIELAQAHGLTKVPFVTLFFDAAHKLIGVKPTRDARDEGALKLSHRKRVSSVRARAFFENYGLKLDATARHPARFDKDSGMLVISVDAIKRKRGRRRKPRV